MSKIKKINQIKNMATFKSFDWDTSLRDNGNNVINFADSNIFYGRNGTGKTTISRILRALETGRLSDKYQAPKFCVEFDDGSKITQDNFGTNSHCIRVFNEDFINENLKFFIDENADISSFAVLGDDNARIEAQIIQLENEIGNEEQNTGLYAILNQTKKDCTQANHDLDIANKELDGLLENKSNDRNYGIRYQPELFGDQNYNKQKLNHDISTIKKQNYTLSNEEQDRLKSLIKEESKTQISPISIPTFCFLELSQQTKVLIEQQILISNPIQELLNNSLLQSWVHQGMHLHKDRETCAFCHNPISTDLWEKLNKHFNQESENLKLKIKSLISNIEKEKQKINYVIIPEKIRFYSEFYQEIDSVYKSFQDLKNNYFALLENLIGKLQERLENISQHFCYKEIYFSQEDFVHLFNEINNIIRKSNNYTNELSSKQSEARKNLRLNEVAKFVNDIQYDVKQQNIENLKNIKEQKEQENHQKLAIIKAKQSEILELKSRLNDEQKGAEKVNEFLTHFLTGQNLCLKAIESSSEKKIRFGIFRNNEKAHNLSEGERTLIAFCYFIAKLSDLSTQGRNPIIFIDDPICSLDSNHIFFIFSLICESLFYKENNGDLNIVTQGVFSQLFISTHNLDFLKYTHRLPSTHRGKSKKFIIEKDKDISCIREMPKYLQVYTTEFNYLFECIYKCSQISSVNDENFNLIFNFGNNARKFLEIYLYYQYPHTYTGSSDKDHTLRLEKFFGTSSIPDFFVNRINNEYSHLSGGLERGGVPIEVSEMQLCAKAILDRIKEKNPEQFQALKDSIGCVI
ncbi:hypothetical protein CT138_10095 [Mannheimia varigena]|uniref:AAA family ATPase n=1 Tax=Mannheimia varigena TaxID=85404 RepID=UPI000DBF2ED6|nr:AAA family ATPase [Mannheimia varigena]AWW35189.1 hypothetical protein CT138_10095 [Mannheimia varigena]